MYLLNIKLKLNTIITIIDIEKYNIKQHEVTIQIFDKLIKKN